MNIVTAEQMKEIDRIAIEEFGIPGSVLMGFAGRAVVEHLCRDFPCIEKISIICGTGNNGGDGFIIAYLLFNKGFIVNIYFAGNKERLSSDSLIYYTLCLKTGVNIIHVEENSVLPGLEEHDVIVDALLGTGIQGPIKGLYLHVVNSINSLDVPVVSIDIPSGLPSNGQAPENKAVLADKTYTIGLPKIGCATFPGLKWCGEVDICDIGFPNTLLNSTEFSIRLIDDSIRSACCKKQDEDTHKGEQGHLLIIGGFDGMEGAAILAARGALKTGPGYISLITTENSRKIIAGIVPEIISYSINIDCDSNSGHDIQKINSSIEESLGKRDYSACVIGPGMGRSQGASVLFSSIMDYIQNHTNPGRILIDGDGLYHLAHYLSCGKTLPEGRIIITPHFGEASRILNEPKEKIKNNRLGGARKLVKKTGAVTLLKGPSTIIANDEIEYVNSSGNSALAVAGSGDVLSGISGGLLLRNHDTITTMACAAYIHGLAADIYTSEENRDSMTPSDIINHIPYV